MAGLISNGSFVLGDPNTRDLYLGKGLKDGFDGDKYYIAADETVLWEGDTPITIGDSITLSESLNNFEYIAVCEGSNNRRQIKYLTASIPSTFVFEGCEIFNWIYLLFYRYSCNADKTVLTYVSNTTIYYKNTDTSVTVQQNASLSGRAHKLKIIGINRKRG